MLRLLRHTLVAVAVTLLAACSTAAGTGASADAEPACSAPVGSDGSRYDLAVCQIPAPSLAANLLGDPAELSSFILTPSGYAASTGRYPSVYVLAGYTDSGATIADAIAAAPPPALDAVVVVVSGVNAFGGSFYVNSPVTGAWEDAIVADLVSYVDVHYRTVARPDARGVAGHSMGGFGALNLAMRHPDVFGATYALSPGLFAPDGAAARLGDPAVAAEVVQLADTLAGLPVEQRLDRVRSSLASLDLRFEWAYGAAFAPEPADPTLMRIPFVARGAAIGRDPSAWAAWEAGFGALPTKIHRYGDNLRRLRAIGLDYGTRDEYTWIPDGCAYLAGLMKKNGIEVTVSTFDGGHEDQLADRLVTHMLPFMASALDLT
jgi:S-formylglutathione hydrolase FrmB